MIVLDFYRINNGGGLILMDTILNKLPYRDNIILLIDKRNNKYINIDDRKIILINSELKRNLFFLQNIFKINKLFIFGNIPPLVPLQSDTYIYFHQKLYLENFIYQKKINKYFLYFILIKKLHRNYVWIFQTKLMEDLFKKKIKIQKLTTICLPYYLDDDKIVNYDVNKKLQFTFLYPTSNASYKNVTLLIHSFIKFYKEFNVGKLFITISKDDLNEDLRNLLNLYDYQIYFLGHLERKDLIHYYESSEFVIHPSSIESFGLVLIESCLMNCKLITPNLPYVNEVVKPSLFFNNFTIESLYNAFKIATTSNLEKSEILIENKLKTLIKLII
jgi:glycosyltransferase involved in cell wall biosynthesis